MSKQIARALTNRMNMREILIAPHYTGLVSDIRELAEADPSIEAASWDLRKNEVLSAYGYEVSANEKSFAYSNGVAIIPVQGLLINRFNYAYSFLTGYNFIRTQIQAAAMDDDVQLIVLDEDSCGGEVAGCFELCEDIYALRDVKPIMAVVDSMCYSAAYAIASACHKIIVTPSGGAGSIGACLVHVSSEKAIQQAGLEVTLIISGDHKADGNPYQSLPASVKADLQVRLDKTRDIFVATVARNRDLDTQVVFDTQARCYRAEDALDLGLIDAVQTPSQAVQAFFDELSGSDPTQEQSMATAQTKPGVDNANTPALEVDTAKITADARRAERERMQGITGSEEAKTRPALANHLALSTELSVDDAKAIMSAAASEVAPAVAATEPVAAAPAAAAPVAPVAASAFHAAMADSAHPNVGADGQPDATLDVNSPKARAGRIIADQEAATGRKIAKR